MIPLLAAILTGPDRQPIAADGTFEFPNAPPHSDAHRQRSDCRPCVPQTRTRPRSSQPQVNGLVSRNPVSGNSPHPTDAPL